MVLVPEEAYAKYVQVLVPDSDSENYPAVSDPYIGKEAQEVMQANVEQQHVEVSVGSFLPSIQRKPGTCMHI